MFSKKNTDSQSPISDFMALTFQLLSLRINNSLILLYNNFRLLVLRCNHSYLFLMILMSIVVTSAVRAIIGILDFIFF
jgi:hypothetical protein